MSTLVEDVRRSLRDIPDFPEPGILFKDITPVLADAELFGRVVRWMSVQHGGPIHTVVGMESRGFIFAAALVSVTGAGFVPARKKGKLPYETVSVSYDLEYGSATLEMHVDAIRRGDRVLVVDDLLATGGTAAATVQLIRKLGGDVIGCCFLVELGFLSGRKRLDVPIASLITV